MSLTAVNNRANENNSTHKTCAKGIFHVVFNIYMYIYILFVLMKMPYAMKAMHIYKNTCKWASNI